MFLKFKNKTLEKECTDFTKATKSYGNVCAKRLHQRVQELKAASSLDEMVQFRIGRCHPLTGDLNGKYALDLEHPYRLIVEQLDDGSGNPIGINIVKLLEVKDYHGN